MRFNIFIGKWCRLSMIKSSTFSGICHRLEVVAIIYSSAMYGRKWSVWPLFEPFSMDFRNSNILNWGFCVHFPFVPRELKNVLHFEWTYTRNRRMQAKNCGNFKLLIACNAMANGEMYEVSTTRNCSISYWLIAFFFPEAFNISTHIHNSAWAHELHEPARLI